METTDLKALSELIQGIATDAANDYLHNELGGKDRLPCGFAWVTCTPEHKGNTKQGRQEIKVLTALGFEKDYTGRSYKLYMPGRISAQCVFVHEAASKAAADLIRNTNIFVDGVLIPVTVYVQSRLD